MPDSSGSLPDQRLHLPHGFAQAHEDGAAHDGVADVQLAHARQRRNRLNVEVVECMAGVETHAQVKNRGTRSADSRELIDDGSKRHAKARSPEVAGLAAQVPAAGATPAKLRNQGQAALRPLMAADPVRQTVGDDRPRGAAPATPLPVAHSAVVHLRRDDLAALPETVPGIREILPNRVLLLPPVVEVRNLPATVEDNKSSSWGVLAINALGDSLRDSLDPVAGTERRLRRSLARADKVKKP